MTNDAPPQKDLTQANIDEVWETILQVIRAHDRTLYVTLTSAGGTKPIVFDGRIFLDLPNDWMLKRVNTPTAKGVIETVIERYFSTQTIEVISKNSYEEQSILAKQASQYAQLDVDTLRLADEESLREEIIHHYSIIKTKQRHIRALQKQIAKLGEAYAPTHMVITIEDYEEEIRSAEEAIAKIKVALKANFEEVAANGAAIAALLTDHVRKTESKLNTVNERSNMLHSAIRKIEANDKTLRSAAVLLDKAIRGQTFTEQKANLVKVMSNVTHTVNGIEATLQSLQPHFATSQHMGNMGFVDIMQMHTDHQADISRYRIELAKYNEILSGVEEVLNTVQERLKEIDAL